MLSEVARQQARAEGLTLLVAENKAGYFGVCLIKPGQLTQRSLRIPTLSADPTPLSPKPDPAPTIQVRNDPFVVLAAVQQEGMLLEFASARLKNDPVVVLAAVQQAGHALWHASDELKNDPELLLTAVQQRSGALQLSPGGGPHQKHQDEAGRGVGVELTDAKPDEAICDGDSDEEVDGEIGASSTLKQELKASAEQQARHRAMGPSSCSDMRRLLVSRMALNGKIAQS